MASSADILCGICECHHVTKLADHWCPECEEGLCEKCPEMHKWVKSSRKHVIITIEQYRKIPDCVSNIGDNCKEHDMKYTIYCPQHDAICCPVCLSTDHKNCVDLKAINELIHNAKTSVAVSSLEQNLTKMNTFTDLAIKKLKENQASVQERMKRFGDQIDVVRNKLNVHLDGIEKSMRLELKDAEKQAMLKIENAMSELTKSSQNVNSLENNIKALKDHATDLQAFYGIKKVVIERENVVEKLHRLSSDGSLKETIIKCTLNNAIKDILSTITTLGSVSVEGGVQSVFFEEDNMQQGQINLSVQRVQQRSIYDVKLTLKSAIKYPDQRLDDSVNGCTFSHEGDLICPSGHNLMILKQNGSVNKVIPLSPYCSDVAVIDETTLAVSTLKGIQIINIINQNQTIVKTGGECYGVNYYYGSLFWCETSEGVHRKNLLEGDVNTLIPQEKLSKWSFLTVSHDKIYLTNKDTKTVSCFTMEGNLIWEFKDESILVNPFGITVDNNTNVFVTSRSAAQVVVISSDGKNAKSLLGKTDGLDNPLGIAFDNRTNNLLICNEKQSCFVYQCFI